jgi:hypothetical protein
MKMLELVSQYWPIGTVVAGSIAAIAVFIRNILEIQQLRLQIRKLKSRDAGPSKEREELIRLATLDEIEKCSRKYPDPYKGAYPPRSNVTSLVIYGYLRVAWVWSAGVTVLCVLFQIFFGQAIVIDVLASIALFVLTASSTTILLDFVYTRRAVSSLAKESGLRFVSCWPWEGGY